MSPRASPHRVPSWVVHVNHLVVYEVGRLLRQESVVCHQWWAHALFWGKVPFFWWGRRHWNRKMTDRQSLVDSVRWLTAEFSTDLQACLFLYFCIPPTLYVFVSPLQLDLSCHPVWRADMQHAPIPANHLLIWSHVTACCTDISTCNEKLKIWEKVQKDVKILSNLPCDSITSLSGKSP